MGAKRVRGGKGDRMEGVRTGEGVARLYRRFALMLFPPHPSTPVAKRGKMEGGGGQCGEEENRRVR